MTLFRVIEIFSVPSLGAVIFGTLESGDIAAGGLLQIESPQGSLPIMAKGLERDRQLIVRAQAGESFAILTGPLDLALVSDGLETDAQGLRKAVALVVRRRRKRWWMLWRQSPSGQHSVAVLSSPQPSRPYGAGRTASQPRDSCAHRTLLQGDGR